MLIKEAKEAVKEVVLHTNIVPALLGERGIGKTEALKQVAAELGMGYTSIYPSSLEGPDFMGTVVKDLEKGITRYLPPQFFPTDQAVREGLFPDHGLLVIEELNRGEVQTIHAMYPLLLEFQVNGHRLASGWKMAVAMNPDTVSYTTVSMDMAAMDRMLILEVEPSVDEYIDYCVSTGSYDRDVLEFLAVHKNMLLVKEASGDSAAKSPSPRAWSRVQDLRQHTRFGDDSSAGLEILRGAVGANAAAAFFGYLRDRDTRPIDAEDVLNGKNVSDDLRRILDKGRFDVLNVTLRELAQVFSPRRKESLVNMERFLLALPEELQVMFCKILHTNRPSDLLKVLEVCPGLQKSVEGKIMDVIRAA